MDFKLLQELSQALRADRGEMSAARLGALLGKKEDYVWRIERGDQSPEIPTLLQWEAHTGGTKAIQILCRCLSLIPIPAPHEGVPIQELTQVFSASAKYLEELSGIYADGKVDEEEVKKREEVVRRCDVLVAAALGIKAKFLEDAEKARQGRAGSILEAEKKQ